MTPEHRDEPIVELWRGRDGLWRYRFVPPEGERIESNRSFPDRREAEGPWSYPALFQYW